MTTKKTAASASAPSKKTASTSKTGAPKASGKKPAGAPKAEAKAAPKAPAKKAAAPVPAEKPAAVKKSTSREVMLARVESVRLAQRAEGHFDCFGRAAQGYCDQGDCAFHAECLSVSRLLHSL